MDIIISANQTILDFMRSDSKKLSDDMTREEYYKLLAGIEGENTVEEYL